MISKDEILVLKPGDFIYETLDVRGEGATGRLLAITEVSYIDTDINGRTFAEVVVLDSSKKSSTFLKVKEGNTKMRIVSTPAKPRRSKKVPSVKVASL